MTAQDAMAVAGAITLILQVLKAAGLSGRWALVVCAAMSLGGVAVWGYSAGTFGQATAWDYFAGFTNVFASSAGIFGIVNKAPEVVSDVRGAGHRLIQSMRGTGDS